MIITYLAISKILYWFNTITAMTHSDLAGAGAAALSRLINQDIMIILGVILFFFLEKYVQFKKLKKSKYNKIMDYIVFNGIGFVAFLGVVIIYILIIRNVIHTDYRFHWGEFIVTFFFAYVVAVVVLELKSYFKSKVKPDNAAPEESSEEKLSILSSMLDDGILTQEEFDNKKEIILGTTK